MTFKLYQGIQPETDYERLRIGQRVFQNGKVYQMCQDCGKVVPVDGFFAGVHLCVDQTKTNKP